jgi:hypothetical protein
MALEPVIALGLVGAEIVENDVEVLARVGGDDAVHEVKEPEAPGGAKEGCPVSKALKAVEITLTTKIV